jgi:FKBP-type peptidyl-prolyl cis-trans isomerase
MVETGTPTEQTSTETTQSKPNTETQEPAELVIEDEIVGNGDAARPGDEVTVKYTGHLSDGTAFASADAGSRLTFTLGMEDVATGLSRGVTGMMVGGKRKLIVAPELGYGAEGNAELAIPPDATLFYEVQLLAVSR